MSWRPDHLFAYHTTRAENLAAILALGLRPTSWWIDNAVGLEQATRQQLSRKLRPTGTWLEHPSGHRAWVREQQPLLQRRLTEVLAADTDEATFVHSMNERVFFFAAEVTARSLAERYRPIGDQVVLRLDIRALLDEAGDRIELSRTTERHQGSHQFVPVDRWPGGRPREMTVVAPGLDPDQVGRVVVGVERVSGSEAA